MADAKPYVPETPAVIWRRRLIWLVVLLVLVIASLTGLDQYRVWRYQNLLDHAAERAEKKDWESVAFSLRQAMQVRPGNIEPVERLAEYAETLEPAEAIHWRRTVASMEPGYVRHRLNWARVALKLGNVPAAAEAFRDLDEASRASAPVQVLLSEIHAAAGNWEPARVAAAEAVTLDPGNITNRFQLSKLQLLGTNEVEQTVARRQLEAALVRPGFALDAARSLAADALRRQDLPVARQRMELVLQHPQTGFGDDLRHLDLLRLEKSPELPLRLAALQSKVATNLASILPLTKWMNIRGLGADAVKWLENMPPDLARNPQLRAARLESYLAAGNGPGCVRWLTSEEWGGDDHLRLALLARVHLGMGNAALAETAWTQAVEKGRGTPAGRRALWQSAAEAGWRERSLAMLELAAEAPTDRRWALVLLFDLYSRVPDSRKMLDASRRLLAIDPEDSLTRNNVAALSLLLKEDTERAHQLAREAYLSRPQDPAILSTYGYSLFVKGELAEALETFERIPPQYAGHPSIAVYYAAILTASGKVKEAAPFLEVAQKGNLLVEERRILTETLEQAALLRDGL